MLTVCPTNFRRVYSNLRPRCVYLLLKLETSCLHQLDCNNGKGKKLSKCVDRYLTNKTWEMKCRVNMEECMLSIRRAALISWCAHTTNHPMTQKVEKADRHNMAIHSKFKQARKGVMWNTKFNLITGNWEYIKLAVNKKKNFRWKPPHLNYKWKSRPCDLEHKGRIIRNLVIMHPFLPGKLRCSGNLVCDSPYKKNFKWGKDLI